LAAILVGSRDQRTQFWKGAIQESFQQSLVDKIKPNLAGMVPGWVPFKIVSDSPALHSRWPLLLKIKISSNGQNCSILSQNVLKFELYKHNDELFNISLAAILVVSQDHQTQLWKEGHPRIISAKFG
jgi:hypothetical protein